MSMTSVDPVLNPAEARAITDQIKTGVEAVWHLITQAYTSRAWSVLGYVSWDDYCTREFGTSRIRLPREERSEVVASLRESGLSLRAIAAATGDSEATVRRSLAGASNDAPAPKPITGTDGKTYTPPPPRPKPNPDPVCEYPDGTPPGFGPGDLDALNIRKPEASEPPTPTPEPAAPKRRPLTEAFDTASYELRRAVERVVRLSEDDRLKKNKDQIAGSNLSDLVRVRDAINGVINTLEG